MALHKHNQTKLSTHYFSHEHDGEALSNSLFSSGGSACCSSTWTCKGDRLLSAQRRKFEAEFDKLWCNNCLCRSS